MSGLLESDERLEMELTGDRVAVPAVNSVLFHLALVAVLAIYSYAHGLFKSNIWGGAANGGAIRVNVTSTIPLPSDQPPNHNVLATEKPSPAPTFVVHVSPCKDFL